MGTYLYLARIDKDWRGKKEREKLGYTNLICFSDDDIWGRNLDDAQFLFTVPEKYYKLAEIDRISGKNIDVTNRTLTEKVREENKVKLKEKQRIIVIEEKEVFYVEKFSFKISSNAKRNIDYYELPVVMTIKNIKSIIEDINDEVLDKEEVDYWKEKFEKIIKEIEDGIIWFKV